MRQLTTARDLTILGRAIRERFPRYYHYFSTPSFTYAGSFMPNHNHLLGRIDGMDGIKTGYTAASGFNLLTSVNRDGRHIVSVVLGGRTAASRDHVMQSLIETHIEEASATPSTRVADRGPVEEPAPSPHEEAAAPLDRQPSMRQREIARADTDDETGPEDAPQASRVTFSAQDEAPPRNVEQSSSRGQNLIAPELGLPQPPLMAHPAQASRPAGVTRAPMQLASADLPSPPAGKPATAATQKPAPLKTAKLDKIRPAFMSGAPKLIESARLPGPVGAKDRQRLALDGSTNRRLATNEAGSGALATATPSSLHWVTGAQPVRLGPSADKAKAVAKPTGEPSATGSIERNASKIVKAEVKPQPPTMSRGGWVIQIGATDDAVKANDLLTRAKAEGRSALASAKPFTEKVQKGEATLFRARFAGLEPGEAEAACKTLKRSGFACFATHN